jgi:hypothetical protein
MTLLLIGFFLSIWSFRKTAVQFVKENFIIVVLITCALVIPFTTLLQPLTSTMLSVKHQMCGGNRTFIVTFNSDTQSLAG